MCNTPSNEDIHESAKDEDKEAGVQCGADIGKVPLGLSRENVFLNCNARNMNLECEGSQANNHSSS